MFELKGKYLQSKYSVYIIEIINEEKSYYYIGQTGDSHYITARSPFRRLVGHMSDSKASTENQIYKYFASTLLEVRPESKSYSNNEKKIIEEFFIKCTIKMYSFPICEFDYSATIEEHKIKRKSVLEFEKQVINLFNQSALKIINMKIPKNINSQIKFVEEFNEIKKIFKITRL
ncbi:MAG: hypothetical protein PHW82_01260 [Bacteroidales bacterium]|nr:hypothetical protein [Bacteroidales bacterium]